MRAVCPKTKGPRAVGCRRTAPERMPILSGRFASGDPSSVRYSGQYEKADACRPCLACEERVVGLLAKKLSEPGPAGDGLPCRDFTVRRVVSRRPARSVSGCRRTLPLPGSSRRSGRGVQCRMPVGANCCSLDARDACARFFRRKNAAFRGLNERRGPERRRLSSRYFS